MFNFGRRKDKDEKDKKKKDKRDRKKQFIDSMTQDELSRLSELRKSVTKDQDKLPSGITADYREHQSPDPDSTSSNTSSTWSGREGSVGRPTTLGSPPPLPERPPPRLSKKSILKSSTKSYDVSRSVSSDLDDANVLLRNTKDNEYINVYRRSALSPQKQQSLSPHKSSPGSSGSGGHSNDFADRELAFEIAPATVKVRVHSNHVSPVTPPENLKVMQQSPIKAKDLNGESVGVKQRPLSCEFPLHLPKVLCDAENEAVREITVDLVAPGDYGFSVRSCQQSSPAKKKSLIIESELFAKFAPGDQLVAVNGTNVQELDRDQIHKLIRNTSGASSLTLHVSLNFF